MALWIDQFRASVGWGNQLTDAFLPGGIPCCSILMDSGRHFWVPGLLADVSAAIATAQQAIQLPGSAVVTVLFLDRVATAAQVEEAMHLLANAGLGCDFLEPGPRVLRDGFLLSMSEDTILDGPPARSTD